MSGRKTGGRPSSAAVRYAVGAVGAAVALVFVPIAFGLVPDRFFDAGCAVGRSFGTRMGCYRLLWNTATTGVFVGIVGPAVGTFLVHREMALIGETLAHTAFAGVAFGTLLFAAHGWDSRLLLTALGAAVVGALVVQTLADRTGAHGDVPIAIVLTGSFALGTVFVDLGGGFAAVDVTSYLFGNAAITDDRSVALMAAMSVGVLGVLAVAYEPLCFLTFDERAARIARIDVDRYNALLVVLTAVVVVGSMQILGVILVAAMLVVPVAAAAEVARSFRESLYVSILLGEFAVITGIALSWRYSLRPGATIVLVAIACYVACVLATRNRPNVRTST